MAPAGESEEAMKQYRAEFDDESVLTFEADNQAEATDIVEAHAQPGEQFTLAGRRSEQTPWSEVKRASCWEVKYDGGCRRV